MPTIESDVPIRQVCETSYLQKFKFQNNSTLVGRDVKQITQPIEGEISHILSLNNDCISKIRDFICPIEYVVGLVIEDREVPYFLQRLANKITYLDLSNLKLLKYSHIAVIISNFIKTEFLKMPGSSQKLPPTREDLQEVKAVASNIANLKNLKHFDLSSWINIDGRRIMYTDEILALIGSNNNLEFLNAPKSRYISLNGISNLTNLKELRYLNLSCSGLKNSHLAEVTKITTLTHLDISHNIDISDEGIVYLETLINLKNLNLSGLYRLTDICMDSVSKLQNLEYLNLSHCTNIFGKTLAFTKNLVKLNHLSLKNCSNIEDGDLENLSTSIYHLDLSGCSKITKNGLAHLVTLELQSLNINFCEGIEDTSLNQLKELKNLKIIKVYGTKISHQGLEHLKKLIPDVKVNFNVGGYTQVKRSQIALY